MWVSLARGDLAATAVHNHRDGVCDLPNLRDLSRPSFERRPHDRARCWWEFEFAGTYVCCCQMCHAGPQRRADRRAMRHEDRAALAVARDLWHAGDPEAFDDITAPRRSKWW